MKEKLLIMKFTLFFSFLFVFQVYAENIYSQASTITLKHATLTLSELFSQIEDQTDYLFIYDEDDVELNQQVKIDSDNNTVAGILAKALQESEIGYVFNNNYISLYKKPADVIAEVPQQSKRQISGKIVDSMGMSIIGANTH